jgi:hypothetical protein
MRNDQATVSVILVQRSILESWTSLEVVGKLRIFSILGGNIVSCVIAAAGMFSLGFSETPAGRLSVLPPSCELFSVLLTETGAHSVFSFSFCLYYVDIVTNVAKKLEDNFSRRQQGVRETTPALPTRIQQQAAGIRCKESRARPIDIATISSPTRLVVPPAIVRPRDCPVTPRQKVVRRGTVIIDSEDAKLGKEGHHKVNHSEILHIRLPPPGLAKMQSSRTQSMPVMRHHVHWRHTVEQLEYEVATSTATDTSSNTGSSVLLRSPSPSAVDDAQSFTAVSLGAEEGGGRVGRESDDESSQLELALELVDTYRRTEGIEA